MVRLSGIILFLTCVGKQCTGWATTMVCGQCKRQPESYSRSQEMCRWDHRGYWQLPTWSKFVSKRHYRFQKVLQSGDCWSLFRSCEVLCALREMETWWSWGVGAVSWTSEVHLCKSCKLKVIWSWFNLEAFISVIGSHFTGISSLICYPARNMKW